jgi:hypothetical protein
MRSLVKLCVVVLTAVAASGQPQASDGTTAITGGGWYLLQGAFETQFAFAAVHHADGRASGSFHHRTEDSSGIIAFKAQVTCVAIDAANGRAWIGGVITKNESTSPAFNTGIHQPGRDIWFRVLDDGEANGAVDRTSFVGFEGVIPTSASYCEQRIWPDGNARTWPVTNGNVSVR